MRANQPVSAGSTEVPWNEEDEYWAPLDEQWGEQTNEPSEGDDLDKCQKQRRRAAERTYAPRRIVSGLALLYVTSNLPCLNITSRNMSSLYQC